MVGIGFCKECEVRIFADEILDEEYFQFKDGGLICADCKNDKGNYSKKKLTVQKGVYGTSEHEVIYLDYNNFGTIEFHYIYDNPTEAIFKKLQTATKLGYEIEFKNF